MAPRGRKPKPSHLKILDGNTGRRPKKSQEDRSPRPRPTAPEPPKALSAEARAEWGRVVPELDRIGMLTVVDRAALVVYCETWSTYVRAQADVKRRGVLVTGYRGSRVKNPALQIARDAAQLVRAMCSEFGLTPSSRGRMSVPEANEDDELDSQIF